MPSWFLQALADWVRLLGGPDVAQFKPRATFPTTADWKRVLRLAAVTTVLSAAVGGSATVAVAGFKDGALAVVYGTPAALVVILAAVLTMLPYCYVAAAICRVNLSLPQATVSLLLFGLPWLPLATLLSAIGLWWNAAGILYVFFFWPMLALILINFTRAVQRLVVSCPSWRVWASAAVFAALFIAGFLAVVLCWYRADFSSSERLFTERSLVGD